MRQRKTTSYTTEFKEQAVKKLFSPDSKGVSETARSIGVPLSTLYCWREKYVKSSIMGKKFRKVDSWTPQQRLEVIIKTSSMTEQERGEYLRSEGLYSSDLDRIKELLCDPSKADRGKGRSKIDPELKTLRNEKKRLESKLKRTQSALAEQSARIILLKKSHEIWGIDEDDE